MEVIYVASPYARDIEKNTEFAKQACRHVLDQGHAFFAPHMLYPAILDENQPEQRQLGIGMGLPRFQAMTSRGATATTSPTECTSKLRKQGVLVFPSSKSWNKKADLLLALSMAEKKHRSRPRLPLWQWL